MSPASPRTRSPPGESFRYEFTVPDPGTYFYHPHTGVQLDRGLYGVLVVDDPGEPGDYDDEWIVVLDDWVDGTGRTPDEVLEQLQAAKASGSGTWADMGGMDMGGMDMGGMDDGRHGERACSRRSSAAPVTSPTRTTWSTAARPRRRSR